MREVKIFSRGGRKSQKMSLWIIFKPFKIIYNSFQATFFILKNKSTFIYHLAVCAFGSLCVCMCIPLTSLIFSTNLYETYYVYSTWVHLNSVLHKCLPSICVSVCLFPLSLLGKDLVKNIPAATKNYWRLTFPRELHVCHKLNSEKYHS
jgi:hypothetical protein